MGTDLAFWSACIHMGITVHIVGRRKFKTSSTWFLLLLMYSLFLS